MSKATLLELADRVEKASGPDRELDGKIFIAVTPSVSDAGRIDQMGGVVGWWPKGKPYQSAREVSAYTASLDAAMTLVPDEWRCGFEQAGVSDHNNLITGWCWPFASSWEPDWQLGYDSYKGHDQGAQSAAVTPALALTAAALRVRAQQEASDADQ